MTAKRIDVKFVANDSCLFEFKIHQDTAFRRHPVVSSVSEKTRRGLLGYLDLRKKLVPFFSIHEIGGVNENTEVRTAG
jgi:hypothetical protein